MSTIGDLTLNMIGRARVRTEYEGATVEGTITSIDLDITRTPDMRGADGVVIRRGDTDVTVSLRLGNIDLQHLNRNHHCEVIR